MQRRTFTKVIGGSLITTLTGIGHGGAEGTALAAPKAIDSDLGIGDEGWSIVVIPDTQNYAKYLKKSAPL